MPRRKKQKTEDTKEEPKFRFARNKAGLTYSRCPIPREQVYQLLNAKHPIASYYIAQETHTTPPSEGVVQTDLHIHCYVEFTKIVDSRSPRVFDLEYNGHTYHPNIRKDANRTWIRNYLMKQDSTPYASIAIPVFVRLAKEGKVDEALDNFAEMYPKEFLISYDRILANARKLGGNKPLHVFPLHAEPLTWDQTKCLVLCGPSNSGKTELAKSTVASMGKTFMFIRHIDQLKCYSGEDYLIFDDLSFGHWHREHCIHLTDIKNPSAIHCRHQIAIIPTGVGRIFTTNIPEGKIFPVDVFGAIDRRIEVQTLLWCEPPPVQVLPCPKDASEERVTVT